MEGLEEVSKLIEPDDYMFTIDLKDGYYHLNMSNQAIPFMGLQWEGIFYVYKVLPFGLAISPLVFSKVIRSVISHLRRKQHRILAYLDNFLGLSKNKSLRTKKAVLKLLAKLGFHISVEKSSLQLEQEKEFLGLLIKSKDRAKFCVPQKKKKLVEKEISRLLERVELPIAARRVARVAGLCISLSRAVGPTRLLLRNLFRDLKTKTSWNGCIQLSQAAINDLLWWKELMMNWDGKITIPKKSDLVLFTDASDLGWGGTVNGLFARGFWTPDLLEHSINYRELTAVFLSLLAFQEQVKGKAILIRTDNITTAAYLNKLTGSSDSLFTVGRAIHNLATNLGCEIIAQYIKGKDNIIADRLSRWHDKNDWMLHPSLFKQLNMIWGPHHIDRMASFTNHQLPRYNSFHYDPGAEAIDAISNSGATTTTM